mgnify:CR=1 FL=1
MGRWLKLFRLYARESVFLRKALKAVDFLAEMLYNKESIPIKEDGHEAYIRDNQQ